MAAKTRAKKTPVVSVGPRGPRGRTGPTGPPGPSSTGEIQQLATQVEQLVKELQVQLTRIAQIQEQLDRLAAGQAMEPRERSSERVNT